jgi:hypothetical protein
MSAVGTLLPMALVFQCPDCGLTLRVVSNFRIGALVHCAKCDDLVAYQGDGRNDATIPPPSGPATETSQPPLSAHADCLGSDAKR